MIHKETLSIGHYHVTNHIGVTGHSDRMKCRHLHTVCDWNGTRCVRLPGDVLSFTGNIFHNVHNIFQTSVSYIFALMFCFVIYIYIYIYWPFMALLIEQLKIRRERGRERGGGMTCSKGTQARSRTQVRCRASAHGTCALPTELNGTPSLL